jgi:hypothetical protein
MPLTSKIHFDFLRALVKYEIKFILIGGHAAIYHGVNRNQLRHFGTGNRTS